mgnify:CR=1 FL=1|jgi:Predicted Zn peptidase
MNIDRFYRRIGVEEPGHIDIRAVAFEFGLEVQFAPLTSCEARIVGDGDRGIITIRQGSHRLRQRFSIAHEIGHWVFHRGKALVCTRSDIGEGWEIGRLREKIADEFAGKLLLPDFLLLPRARKIRRLTFGEITKVATEFRVSKSATARRLVELDLFPAVLVGYNHLGRRWVARSKIVPEHWFPQRDLDAESDVMRCLFSGHELGRPTKIGADAFFDRREAERFVVLEETILVGDRDALTLITITDERMLDDD